MNLLESAPVRFERLAAGELFWGAPETSWCWWDDIDSTFIAFKNKDHFCGDFTLAWPVIAALGFGARPFPEPCWSARQIRRRRRWWRFGGSGGGWHEIATETNQLSFQNFFFLPLSKKNETSFFFSLGRVLTGRCSKFTSWPFMSFPRLLYISGKNFRVVVLPNGSCFLPTGSPLQFDFIFVEEKKFENRFFSL